MWCSQRFNFCFLLLLNAFPFVVCDGFTWDYKFRGGNKIALQFEVCEHGEKLLGMCQCNYCYSFVVFFYQMFKCFLLGPEWGLNLHLFKSDCNLFGYHLISFYGWQLGICDWKLSNNTGEILARLQLLHVSLIYSNSQSSCCVGERVAGGTPRNWEHKIKNLEFIDPGVGRKVITVVSRKLPLYM